METKCFNFCINCYQYVIWVSVIFVGIIECVVKVVFCGEKLFSSTVLLLEIVNITGVNHTKNSAISQLTFVFLATVMELHPILDVTDEPLCNLWYVVSCADPPCPRVGQACVFKEDDHSIYILGGADPSTTYNDVFKYVFVQLLLFSRY